MLKRALVVGASSGIGAALTRRLAREGYLVAAVARRADALQSVCDQANEGAGEERALPFVHDVTDVEGTQTAFDRIVAALDGLDLVVYCAGVMPDIEPDGYNTPADEQIIRVNVIGAMAWLNPAATRFQVQHGGTIVGIGSVAGDRGRRGNPAYCASKAAVHTYLESLRNRLSQHGVRVITVKPGPVDTPMTQGRDKLPLLIDADKAADRIVGALSGSGTVYVPLPWWPIMTVIQHIPSVIFRRLDL